MSSKFMSKSCASCY